jgi:hypothetical protein
MSDNAIGAVTGENVFNGIRNGEWGLYEFGRWVNLQIEDAMRKQRGHDQAMLEQLAIRLPLHGQRSPFR